MCPELGCGRLARGLTVPATPLSRSAWDALPGLSLPWCPPATSPPLPRLTWVSPNARLGVCLCRSTGVAHLSAPHGWRYRLPPCASRKQGCGAGPQPAVWGEADPVLSRSAPAMAASGLCAVSVATQRAQGLPGCPAWGPVPWGRCQQREASPAGSSARSHCCHPGAVVWCGHLAWRQTGAMGAWARWGCSCLPEGSWIRAHETWCHWGGCSATLGCCVCGTALCRVWYGPSATGGVRPRLGLQPTAAWMCSAVQTWCLQLWWPHKHPCYPGWLMYSLLKMECVGNGTATARKRLGSATLVVNLVVPASPCIFPFV